MPVTNAVRKHLASLWLIGFGEGYRCPGRAQCAPHSSRRCGRLRRPSAGLGPSGCLGDVGGPTLRRPPLSESEPRLSCMTLDRLARFRDVRVRARRPGLSAADAISRPLEQLPTRFSDSMLGRLCLISMEWGPVPPSWSRPGRMRRGAERRCRTLRSASGRPHGERLGSEPATLRSHR